MSVRDGGEEQAGRTMLSTEEPYQESAEVSGM